MSRSWNPLFSPSPSDTADRIQNRLSPLPPWTVAGNPGRPPSPGRICSTVIHSSLLGTKTGGLRVRGGSAVWELIATNQCFLLNGQWLWHQIANCNACYLLGIPEEPEAASAVEWQLFGFVWQRFDEWMVAVRNQPVPVNKPPKNSKCKLGFLRNNSRTFLWSNFTTRWVGAKTPTNKLQIYLSNVRFIFLASEWSNKTVWPQAALISFHSTWKRQKIRATQWQRKCSQIAVWWTKFCNEKEWTSNLTGTLGNLPKRKLLIVPKCPLCLKARNWQNHSRSMSSSSDAQETRQLVTVSVEVHSQGGVNDDDDDDNRDS